MAFRDWSDDDYAFFQEEAFTSIYNEIPSVPYLSEESDDEARDLFFTGWLDFGASELEREAARQDFYDAVNMQESQFDWEEWRDLYDSVNG